MLSRLSVSFAENVEGYAEEKQRTRCRKTNEIDSAFNSRLGIN
ncbi:MAG: hypothetical protein SPI30_01940 [Prevotella sp.]|nr:hypothetical protein [Prevotella sp.]